MKLMGLSLALVGALLCNSAFAKGGGHSGGHSGSHASRSSTGTHTVRGYTRKNGTYVAPHRQTNPNKSKKDNWLSKGNVNPDTGKAGTKDPDKP